MEPITLCLGVLSAVKQGVALYKDFKSTGKEVYGVMQEISSGLGTFFEHQEKAHETIKELEKLIKKPDFGNLSFYYQSSW